MAGFALWTAYGIGLGEWPLIVTNSICFVLSAFILMMTLLPQAKKERWPTKSIQVPDVG
ncbi:uncharacterized protein with PQ loop repeat [Bosea sp. BE271]|uniref:hypothetical protein n=1 Tax=Bosea TaxID=85413 RepID=UPI00286382BB|nr:MULTISPECIES: hypothetical protein [Bosea]MDR6831479.1 uncharacterized protein with PQ loop repeat [Bosea robiniae]MDR6897285.1 uncharacterized protein with PQ loop repeat [Bosea sp. BE109]MDR7140682.1 uncharacterized protein with PQ loop repeat [Bosea sp. BE168]MDR7177774.1 uncharacterized protein with PQ loop repeat [Bosea sp. BE271]